MSPEEAKIYEFLKRFGNRYVSVNEISRATAPPKAFNEDRHWALPILRRMELVDQVEVNSYGEYRLKHQPEETTSFKKALDIPGVSLGDTTIVSFEDTQGNRETAA